jgi:hypothetical protein
MRNPTTPRLLVMKKSEKTESARQHWRKDPVAFIRGVLIDPETKRPFELYLEEETFLRTALSLTPSGELPYAELLFSAPMKSGKTALAAMIVLYVIIALAGQNGEAYCVANDFEQAAGRVFQAIVRILRASPLLRRDVKITGNRIVVEPTGSVIAAIASDFAGAAGSNRNIAVFDELWGYRSTAAERLWNEMVPVPTRKVSCRLTVTYAGFSGEKKSSHVSAEIFRGNYGIGEPHRFKHI